jgi:hypothetical protein
MRLLSNWMKRRSFPKGQRNRQVVPLVAFFKNLTARGIFLFWLAGLCIVGVLLWTLTRDGRRAAEMRAANTVLEAAGEQARLVSLISPWLFPGAVSEAGTWWTLDDKNPAVIFTVPYHGIFTPFIALFDDKRAIAKIYPLSAGAALAQKRLAPAIFALWETRITNAARLLPGAPAPAPAGTKSP